MKKTNWKKLLPAAALLLVLAAGVIYAVMWGREKPAERTFEEQSAADIPTAAKEDQTQIVLQQDNSRAVYGSGAASDTVSIENNRIRIGAGGTYRLTGKLDEGQIYVETSGDEEVVLILAGVTVHNGSEAAVYIENAGHTYLLTEEGTENLLQSGTETEISANAPEGGDFGEEKADASGGALHARDDLTIAGEGSLKVCGYINNGIHVTNNLTVQSGNLEVEAVNCGIKGKDSVLISGGNITVLSGGDGIKSDDTSGEGYGVVSVSGGKLEITSGKDGIQAETYLTVKGGVFALTTGGGSEGVVFPAQNGWGRPGAQWDLQEESEESTKGLKGGTGLYISGGSFTVDSRDDAFHTNGTMLIEGGSFTVSSGDDGFHADTELTVTDGEIKIESSYEGMEAVRISLQGGDISIAVTDDGINANGGNSFFGRGIRETGTSGEMPRLYISGGNILVNADGDGLDSNGDLVVDGGTVVVNGPDNTANGAIDAGTENGGSCVINGGTVIALGSIGMAETFTEESGQYSFRCNLNGTYGAGDEIVIADADGNILYRYTAIKPGSSVVFSSPELKQGETYTLQAGALEEKISLTSVSTLSGSQGGWQQLPGGQQRPSGQRGPGMRPDMPRDPQEGGGGMKPPAEPPEDLQGTEKGT